MKIKTNKVIFLITSFLFIPFLLYSQKMKEKHAFFPKSHAPSDRESATIFSMHDVWGWIHADGKSGLSPDNDAGIYFPAHLETPVVYQDGFFWGGFVQDGKTPALRTGGQWYSVGTVPGRIISVGVPQDPEDPAVRVYRIHSDYENLTDEQLRQEAVLLNSIRESQVTSEQIEANGNSMKKTGRSGRRTSVRLFMIGMRMEFINRNWAKIPGCKMPIRCSGWFVMISTTPLHMHLQNLCPLGWNYKLQFGDTPQVKDIH